MQPLPLSVEGQLMQWMTCSGFRVSSTARSASQTREMNKLIAISEKASAQVHEASQCSLLDARGLDSLGCLRLQQGAFTFTGPRVFGQVADASSPLWPPLLGSPRQPESPFPSAELVAPLSVPFVSSCSFAGVSPLVPTWPSRLGVISHQAQLPRGPSRQPGLCSPPGVSPRPRGCWDSLLSASPRPPVLCPWVSALFCALTSGLPRSCEPPCASAWPA